MEPIQPTIQWVTWYCKCCVRDKNNATAHLLGKRQGTSLVCKLADSWLEVSMHTVTDRLDVDVKTLKLLLHTPYAAFPP
jgi:hypothetical protein